VAEWITDTITRLGYPGIAFLMFLENVFPPIPSELIMPFAGFAAARGGLSMPGVVAAGLVGTVLGALPWYVVGRIFGYDRVVRLAQQYGRLIRVSGADVVHAKLWFDRYGARAVFLGRFVPAVRTLISVPAGIAAMPLLPFLLLTTAGSLGWTLLLAVAGYVLGENYALVERYIGPLSTLVVAAIGLVAVLFVGRRLLAGRRERGGVRPRGS
jgi:membrane protein DedA with SNARE-associated domain